MVERIVNGEINCLFFSFSLHNTLFSFFVMSTKETFLTIHLITVNLIIFKNIEKNLVLCFENIYFVIQSPFL